MRVSESPESYDISARTDCYPDHLYWLLTPDRTPARRLFELKSKLGFNRRVPGSSPLKSWLGKWRGRFFFVGQPLHFFFPLTARQTVIDHPAPS